jgi:hypothetical protein
MYNFDANGLIEQIMQMKAENYLERYIYLLILAAYLHEWLPQNLNKPFTVWFDEHPAINTILREIRLKPQYALNIRSQLLPSLLNNTNNKVKEAPFFILLSLLLLFIVAILFVYD